MKQMRRMLIALVVLCGAAGIAFAQSNEIVDDLLAHDAAPLGPVAYLIFSAAGIADDGWGVQESLEELGRRGLIDPEAADEPVSLGLFAYLVMTTFDMGGGVLYAAFPGPRYAAREFAFREFVTGNTSPYRVLSGSDVTHIIGRVVEFLGQREVEEVSE